ncbi:hypothetical protein D9M70_333780 [compost metagenome]
MTFNTGNPVGSTDARDLYDNAQNFDKFSIGTEPSYQDRLGVSRKSIAGMESDFTAFLEASGFEPVVLQYVDGSPLTVDRPTQLIERASTPGILYAIKLPSAFPASLSGSWAADEALLVIRIDDALRQELAGNDGADLIGYGSESVRQALDNLQQKATFTVYVPSHYPNLQAAVDAVSKFRVSNGQFIDVMIEAGYQIASGLSVANIDLSHVRIKSVDASVSLAPGFAGIPSSDPFADNAIFAADNAGMVQLACVINANDLGGPGYYLTKGSRGFVAGGCGVWNAGKFGLYLTKGSRCIAANADFRQANWGNRVTTNSMLEAPQCKFYGAKVATYEGSNKAANLDVSRGSVVYITGSTTEMTNLIGGAGHGLAVRRSFVSATLVDCSSVSGNGLNIGSGSVVTFQGGRAASCGVDAVACDASFVDASNAALINAGRYGVYADSGGKISARGVSAGGAITSAVRAANGSTINVSSGACRKGATDSSTDIVVSGGSIVHAVGAAGGTNISALTLNIEGLIFK